MQGSVCVARIAPCAGGGASSGGGTMNGSDGRSAAPGTPGQAWPERPSRWVTRFAPLVPRGGSVLDFACGGGRHARWLARRGWQVEAVDRDAAALAALADEPGVRSVAADLEGGEWPYAGRSFDGVVVTNYLYRPRLPLLLDCVAPGGVLVYETFMVGNERLGRPANPEFLLQPGELLARLAGAFTIVAFEQGEVSAPRPAVVQRVCAIRGPGAAFVLPAAEATTGA